MNKKIVLNISLLGSISCFILFFLHNKGMCKTLDIYSSETFCGFGAVATMIFLSTLFFSLMLLFIKKESVFNPWKKFTFIYFFIYLFIVIITPWYTGDEFLSIQKDILAIWLTFFYSIISLILILSKSLKKSPNSVLK